MIRIPDMHNKSVGRIGEDLTVAHLIENGYQIIERNYTSRWGEIDIISQKDNVLIFVEVKTKIGDKFGKPWEAVTFSKLKKLNRSIQYYLTSNKIKDIKCRIDVVAIELTTYKTLKSLKIYEGR